MTSPRHDPLPAGRLEERFQEKLPAYTTGEAAAEAARCLYCFDAPCMRACPTHIDIASFIRKIGTGNLGGSARTILASNLLGASCARVCPVEVLCEGACVYTAWGRKPISIGRLQRYAMTHGSSPALLERRPPTGRSVGLVGGGPASLACAGKLSLAGHTAVVYEKNSFAGGLNTSGVAPYKLGAREALEEVEFVRALGVEIRTGVEIGRDVDGAELLRRHDAVFLGVGLGADTPLTVPGAAGPGVIGAVEWIRRMKLEPGCSLKGVRSAAVVGGGNTALDAARELVHLGVDQVHLVYRRSEEEMSGYRHEWEPAKREGVQLVPNALVKEVVRIKERVHKLRLCRARDGRPTNGELTALVVDLVVVATGQARIAALVGQFSGVGLDDSGCIVAEPGSGRTGNPRVFAAGDAVNGGKEVVNAVAEGQDAARAIDALLAREGMLRHA